jgi:ABC-type nitrate/sulfonate/bicarbonate transport system ATPase subunit
LNDTRRAGESGRLEVRDVRKSYVRASGERLEVLRDIAFTLEHGQVGAFVGPSGCGKTTMLRIIAGLDADYRGTVVRAPDVVLGMVFQEPRLLPWRTVEDNVRLVAPHATAATLATLFDVLELDTHRRQFPGELSLGLARRVALARAMAVEPTLLILDEPFVSLDDALAERLRDELAMLVDRRPVTTLLVTHDIDEAARLADRLFLLSARPARIVADMPISIPRAERGADRIASIRWDVAHAMRANGRTTQT